MKTVFYFILSDLFYFLPIIKQFKLLDGGLIIWGIIYATAMLALIFWFPLDNLIPSDIPQKTFKKWNMILTIYLNAIGIYALWYVLADTVPWVVWWLVTLIFVTYLSFQIGYGIWRIAK